MNIIRATNAVELTVETTMGGQIALTVRVIGSTRGQIRAFLDTDTAGILSAVLANRIDNIRRG